jgi:ABC-2 type transport system permease protein
MAAFAAVLLLSGAAAWIEVGQAARTKATVAAYERQRWLGQGEKDPHSAAHYSVYAFKPSLPLQAVDPGIVPFVGEAVWLEAHHQNDLIFRPQQDANAFERMGLVDPAGLLTRFGPLAIFLLAFAAAARERECGVLGLTLGTTSSRKAYLAAKVASVTGVGALVLVLPVVLTGAVSVLSGTENGTDAALRLTGWTLSAVSYVAVMSMIAVFIYVVAPSVQVAFAGLLLVWVVFVVGALPAASAAAEGISPLPSFQQMKIVLTDEAPAYWTPEAGADQIAGILRRYGVSRESDLTVNLRGAQLDVAERQSQAVFDREIGGFYDRVAAQDITYARLGWLSAAVAFDVTSLAFAGTDFVHHRHFIEFAEHYRRELVNRMNADLIPHLPIDGRLHTNNVDLWSQRRHASKPHLPLSILSVGQSDLQPFAVPIRLETLFGGDPVYDFEHPRALATGSFDLGFVLTFVLPLCLGAVAAAIGAHERDQGILADDRCGAGRERRGDLAPAGRALRD